MAHLKKPKMSRVVVVVEWSAFLPCITMIQVRILLQCSTVFITLTVGKE